MFGWGKKSSNADAKAHAATLPECLRSKLVLSYGEQQTGLLKRSSTDDLVRPGQMLGKGTFGVVKLRHCKHTGEPKAVKTIEKPQHWNRERLVHEAVIMQSLDHPHIARIFGWHEGGDSITMVMEYCAGGEFLEAVGKAKGEGEIMRESWATVAFKQLFEAMAYCQSRGLVHMDIKGGNILLLREPEPDIKALFKTAPHVVVADLGLALVLDPTSSWFRKKLAGDAKGTPATMAPEVWRGDIGPKADMWGLGCILYELLCWRLPYFPADPHDQRQKTWENLYKVAGDDAKQRLEVCDCSEEAKSLCMRLLTVDYKDRPIAKECLQHAWFARFLPHGPIDDTSQMSDLTQLCKAVTRWPQRNMIQKALCLKLAAEHRGTAKFSSVFAMFDSDRNGVLSRSELTAALTSMDVELALANKVAQALDYNNDGVCEYLEFSAACLSALGDEYEQILLQEFNVLESFGDGKGKLSKASFKRMLDKLKPICDQRILTVEDVVHAFGASQDGYISFEEFAAKLGGKPLPDPVQPAVDAPKQTQSGQSKATQEVQYFSKSHMKWIDTCIAKRRDDGSLQLEIKPGYWMTQEEQAQLLRNTDGRAFVPESPRVAKPKAKAAPKNKAAPAAGQSSGAPKAEPLTSKTNASDPANAACHKRKLKSTRSNDSVGRALDYSGKDDAASPPKAGALKRASSSKFARAKVQKENCPCGNQLNFEAPPGDALPSIPPTCPTIFQTWRAEGPKPKLSQSSQLSAGPTAKSSVRPPSPPPRAARRSADDGAQSGGEAGVQRSPDADQAPDLDRYSSETPTRFTSASGRSASRSQSAQRQPAPEENGVPSRAAAESAPGGGNPMRKRDGSTRRSSRSPPSSPQSSVKPKAKPAQKLVVGSDASASTATQTPAKAPRTSRTDVVSESSKEKAEAGAADLAPKMKFDAEANDRELEKVLKVIESQPEVYRKPKLDRNASLLFRLATLPTMKTKALPDDWGQLALDCPLMSPARKAGKMLVVLDWDDTIVPTTFIQNHLASGAQNANLDQLREIGRSSKYYNTFLRHSNAVEGVLRASRKVAHVAVLTLAHKWWFDTSVEKYFPGVDMQKLLEELEIPTYHADREAPNVVALSNAGQDASLIAKRSAFSACLKDFYGDASVQWNVLSVGDAMVEHDALKEVLGVEAKSENSKVNGQPLCKTVKLMEKPSVQDLTWQLESMLPSIRAMVESESPFHRII